MAGKFELYTDATGKYRFRLKASNGQVIAVGEGVRDESGGTERDRFGEAQRAGRHH